MDLYFFNLINQFAEKWIWLDALGIFFAEYLGYILIFLLLPFLFFDFKKYKIMIVGAFVSAGLARFGAVEIIRWFLPINRPFVENIGKLLIDYSAKPSFPSGHAAFYFALSAVVFLYNKKIGIFFLTGSLLISLARVFVGVHWPSDVLAGMGVGLLFAAAARKTAEYLKNRQLKRIAKIQ